MIELRERPTEPTQDERRTPIGRYLAASLGLMVLASANGALRDLTYGRRMSEDEAHRLSFVPMVVLFALYVNELERRSPLPTWRGAAGIGACWAAIGAGFELGVGHYVQKRPWRDLVHEYDLSAGRAGGLVLLATAAMPALVRLGRRRACDCS
jgi:hypothetical protein